MGSGSSAPVDPAHELGLEGRQVAAAAAQELEGLALYLLHMQPRAVHARHCSHRIACRRSRRLPNLPPNTPTPPLKYMCHLLEHCSQIF